MASASKKTEVFWRDFLLSVSCQPIPTITSDDENVMLMGRLERCQKKMRKNELMGGVVRTSVPHDLGLIGG